MTTRWVGTTALLLLYMVCYVLYAKTGSDVVVRLMWLSVAGLVGYMPGYRITSIWLASDDLSWYEAIATNVLISLTITSLVVVYFLVLDLSLTTGNLIGFIGISLLMGGVMELILQRRHPKV